MVVITVCQCNIRQGGKRTLSGGRVVYDTADRFARFVADQNSADSAYPPISVIGMQELMTEADRVAIEGLLSQHTGSYWGSARTAQGVNGTSGIGFFWRRDLVNTRPEWDFGSVLLDRLDNGYAIRFAARLFAGVGTDELLGVATGKLVWDGAVLNGRVVTHEDRRQEAITLKNWLAAGGQGSLGFSLYPDVPRVIATDLNADTSTPTWREMGLEYSDPSTDHTFNSLSGGTIMDRFGRRLDYLWLAGGDWSASFAYPPRISGHFGSDHRAVYVTIQFASQQ